MDKFGNLSWNTKDCNLIRNLEETFNRKLELQNWKWKTDL